MRCGELQEINKYWKWLLRPLASRLYSLYKKKFILRLFESFRLEASVTFIYLLLVSRPGSLFFWPEEQQAVRTPGKTSGVSFWLVVSGPPGWKAGCYFPFVLSSRLHVSLEHTADASPLEPEGGNLQVCHQAWIHLLTQNSWVLTKGYLIVWFQRIEGCLPGTNS